MGEAPSAALTAGFSILPDEGTLVVAVSGGPDSIALLHLLADWARGRETRLMVATVDHGLRPGSRAEADGVGEAARALGLPHRLLAWDRAPDTKRPGQAAARAARYALLADLARALDARGIVTAHTLDDQAETLLMRMAAGSGPAGLAGMRPVSVPCAPTPSDGRAATAVFRPLLAIPKADLVAACRAAGWGYVQDPSNADPAFARTRWRALLPALAAEGLDARRLGRLAGRWARADDALEAAAREAAGQARTEPDGSRSMPLTILAGLPEETALRVLGRLATAGEGIRPRLERLETCLAALLAGGRAGVPVARTLAGRLVRFDPRSGLVTLAPEGPRRRGRGGR